MADVMPIYLLSIVFRDVVMAPILNYKISWTFTVYPSSLLLIRISPRFSRASR